MTSNSLQEPRAFSWRRPLIVNATLALTFLAAAAANIVTAETSNYLQIDLLALTFGFLVAYVLRYHKQSTVSVRQWLFVAAQAVFAGWSYNVLKIVALGG